MFGNQNIAFFFFVDTRKKQSWEFCLNTLSFTMIRKPQQTPQLFHNTNERGIWDWELQINELKNTNVFTNISASKFHSKFLWIRFTGTTFTISRKIWHDMTRYDTMWHYIKEDMTRFSNWRLRCNFEIQYFRVIIPRNRQSMNFFKRSPASAPPTSPQKWTFNKLTKAEVINLQVTHFRTSRRVICH